MTEFSARRTMMVDTQVRPSDVTKFPIIEALLSVPREVYVPAALREAAYMGENIAISTGRVILEPRTLAKLLDALDVRSNELVLDVGPVLGYSTAVIARLAEAVVALEGDTHAGEAERTLAAQGVDNATVVAGDLASGAAKHAPYDVVMIEGGVEAVPQALIDQVKDGGRIGAIFMEGGLGVVRVGHKTGGRVNWRFAFNAAAPVMPGFAATRSFAL